MYQIIVDWLLAKTPIIYWTQSLWRDEAFSIWIAQDSVREVITRTMNDFNPPFYYLTLHFWMQFFGRNEIVTRGLSFIAFLVFLFFVSKFAREIYKSEKWVVITTLLAAFNPMLLYFAFELRMYSFLYLFATMSMYFLYIKNWPGYILSSVLGLYTQPFMLLVLVSQIPYFLLTKKFIQGVKCALVIFILYVPWLPVIISQFNQSAQMWIYPVDFNLILSALGNLFTGYEGTPDKFWLYTKIISVILVILSFRIIKTTKNRNIISLTLGWIYIPLVIVLAYSFKKPIFVNRYIIYITAGEVMLLSLFLSQIKIIWLQQILIVVFIGLSFLGNFWAVNFHRKVNIRDSFINIRSAIKSGDEIYVNSPLVFFETLYYAPDDINVYLYNPQKITMPKYVGSDAMSENVWRTSFPKEPDRAFLVEESGLYKIVSQP